MSAMRGAAQLLAAVLSISGAPPVFAQTVDPAPPDAAAEAGEAEYAYRLAETYRRGIGVPQDYARAAELYRQAADQGHPGAQNALAGLYANGFGVARDAARAFELVSKAADSGQAEYLHTLATLIETGTGTGADPARAAELYRQAADLGWMPARVALAVLYQEGKGVAQDIPHALELYTAPAEAGDARAQNNLGLILARGEGGVAQDYAKAAEWYARAADQGLPDAIRNLAVMYQNGFGVPVDEAEAARLNRLAALAPGQTATPEGDAAGIALLYDPRLLPPDAALVSGYVAAARAGDPVALFVLGYLRARAAGSAAGLREAAGLFRQAAQKGSAPAMANLGLMMFEGRGVLQDYVEGYKWLSLAAISGLPGTEALRDRLAARMTPAQINAANALAQEVWDGNAP